MKNCSLIISLLIITVVNYSCSNKKASKHFYANGKLQSLTHSVNTVMIDSTLYFENGKIKSSYLLNKNRSLISTEYNSDGQVLRIDSFGETGDGIVRTYFNNGKLESIGYYLSDSIVYAKAFGEDGKLKGEKRVSSLTTKNDSIKIGGYYDAEVNYLGPPFINSDERAIAYGNIALEGSQLNLDSIALVEDNQFKVHLKVPPVPGFYHFDCIVKVEKKDGNFVAQYPLNYVKIIKVVR